MTHSDPRGETGIKVLMVTSEMAPLAKTGGLGDVLGSLPVALGELGVTVAVVLPFYRQVADCGLELGDTGLRLVVEVGKRRWPVEVWRTAYRGVAVYLLRQDALYWRPGIYGDARGDYPDNAERFVLLCRGAVELAGALGERFEVVHLHDWQAGLVAAYLEAGERWAGGLAGAASLITVHNLAFQGLFPAAAFALTGLPRRMYTPQGLEYWGQVSFLKAGLVYAGAVTTVSPGYAREIQEPQGGMGLEGVLRQRAARGELVGILNGADYATWSPEHDPWLPATYSARDLGGKAVCRRELCARLGLEPPGEGTAVIGFVGRLTEQKGVDLLLEAAPGLMGEDVRLVILGLGRPELEAGCRELAAVHPGRVAAVISFDEGLAHLVVAGSDILVMPSRFEPCGLTQMYALRYGTVPVVRATGGLRDTVEPCEAATGRGTGLWFQAPEAGELAAALRQALALRRQPEAWRRLVSNAMAADFSWRCSAARYAELYARLVQTRKT